MRPLFVSLLAVLAGVVHADQYTATKPAEQAQTSTGKGIVVPRPLEPLTPLIPSQPTLFAPRLPPPLEEQGYEAVRGQSRTVDELAGLLGSPPPLAQGAVAEGVLNPQLTGATDATGPDLGALAENLGQYPAQTSTLEPGTKLADPLGHTILLMATAITTIGLLYMAFVAYDYRQRWMQSLMMQNDRYLVGGAFDIEKTEDTYGAYSGSPSFSEGFGLARRSI